jgi:protein SCO1/2
MNNRRFGALMIAAALAISACGSNDPPREFAGYRREPTPEVGDLTLPDLTDSGTEFAFRADPGELLVVYFGYTNCPDFCPTTLSDLRLATRRMDVEDATKIDVAMVTVDPERDIPILPEYITSFFDDGHALGTDDNSVLAQAAAPFGVSYNVDSTDPEVIEVAHSTSLYVVDDTGQLILTWQFGVPIDDLAGDLTQLLNAAEA